MLINLRYKYKVKDCLNKLLQMAESKNILYMTMYMCILVNLSFPVTFKNILPSFVTKGDFLHILSSM